jgi:hypothetical protein
MKKFIKMFEDAGDALLGGEADQFKQTVDTKTNAVQQAYEPVTKVEEDTTNPDGAMQQDGQELRSNDDLSNFALPVSNNESKLQNKVKKNMEEWKKGQLKTGTNKKVTDQKQALAIAYSEAGKSKNESTIYTFESFVAEKYDAGDKKLEDKKDKQRENLMGDPKKRAATQKKITKTLTSIRKSSTKA